MRKSRRSLVPPNLKRIYSSIDKFVKGRISSEQPTKGIGKQTLSEKRKEKRKVRRKLRRRQVRANSHNNNNAAVTTNDHPLDEDISSDEPDSPPPGKRPRNERPTDQTDTTRNDGLLKANELEDRNILRLERRLKMKGKKKLPQSFKDDGLDFVLDALDSKNAQRISQKAFHPLDNSDSESDGNSPDEIATNTNDSPADHDEDNPQSDYVEDDQFSGTEDGNNSDYQYEVHSSTDSDPGSDAGSIGSGDDADNSVSESVVKVSEKKVRFSDMPEPDKELVDSDNIETKATCSCDTGAVKSNSVREDIYGRLLDAKGEVIATERKPYVPPALRETQDGDSSNQCRLRVQLNGLVNKVCSSNVLSIFHQIEGIYRDNSRAEVTDVLSTLVIQACVSRVPVPSRLAMELSLLIALLHAQIGCTVGGHLLETLAVNFNEEFLRCEQTSVEDKTLDNICQLLCCIFSFRVTDSKLIFDVIDRISSRFNVDKDVELVVLIMKTAGFGLRKQNPEKLKEVIRTVHEKCDRSITTGKTFSDQSRVQFMFEILMAIKNNSMRKIPGYDTSHLELLQKMLKGAISSAKINDALLSVGLNDLLYANDRGRPWIVGSSWTSTSTRPVGSTEESKQSLRPDSDEKDAVEVSVLAKANKKKLQFDHKLLKLAKKQHMNTEIRRNVFCILMSSESVESAFERLLGLGLKGESERQIVHVSVHCCLQENCFNPYYSQLISKFLRLHKRFLLTFKFLIWDRLRDVDNLSKQQSHNFADLLQQLFASKTVPVIVLKGVEFAEMGSSLMHLLKRTFVSLLQNSDEQTITQIFSHQKLGDHREFRHNLQLFLTHFVTQSGSERLLHRKLKAAESALNLSDI